MATLETQRAPEARPSIGTNVPWNTYLHFWQKRAPGPFIPVTQTTKRSVRPWCSCGDKTPKGRDWRRVTKGQGQTLHWPTALGDCPGQGTRKRGIVQQRDPKSGGAVSPGKLKQQGSIGQPTKDSCPGWALKMRGVGRASINSV